jgi:1-acyl-sn-glycerol-3-phosphate acyltransferase
MMKKYYSFLLKLLGWKYFVNVEIPYKCVICVAPHTSNWDFFIGMIFYKSIGGHPHFLMKKSIFFFPLNYLLKSLGGFPVDRKKKNSLSEQMVKEFSQRDHFQLAIAPEGTRKKTTKWKTGFYYIALAAKVPITLAYLDYKEKMIGVIENFIPTGIADADIAQIQEVYKPVTGKHPKQFTLD